MPTTGAAASITRPERRTGGAATANTAQATVSRVAHSGTAQATNDDAMATATATAMAQISGVVAQEPDIQADAAALSFGQLEMNATSIVALDIQNRGTTESPPLKWGTLISLACKRGDRSAYKIALAYR